MRFYLLLLLFITASSYAQQNQKNDPKKSKNERKINYQLITLTNDINNYQVPYDDILGVVTTYKNPLYSILEKIILGLKNDNLDFSLVNTKFIEIIKSYITSNDFPKEFTNYRFGTPYYIDDLYHVEFLLDSKYKGELMLSFEDNQYKLMAVSTTTNF